MNKNLMMLLKTAASWTPAVPFAAGAKGVWYDPSDLATLFQDSAGTIAVTAAGDPVGKMLDKSGLGYHLTQSDSAKRPVLQNDGANYYLSFDGFDDCLFTSAQVDLSATNELTQVVGLRKTRNQNAEVVYEHSNAANWMADGSCIFACTWTSGGDLEPGVCKTAYYQPSLPVGVAATAVVTQTAKISPSTQATWKNGSQALSASNTLGTGNMRSAKLYVGLRAGPAFPFQGRLYQLAIWDRLSDSTTLAKIDAWCNSKTGAY